MNMLPMSHGTNTVRSTWPVALNTLYFYPEPWEMIPFDKHMFKMGGSTTN